MNKPMTDMQHPKMLLDPYATWAANEGVPITEDFGIDLLAVPTAPWPRFGVDGGIAHLKGRGDFVSIFVLDLAPGAKTVAAEAPVRGGRLRALRSRQHHGRDQRRPQAQLRMGTQEPVRAAAQRPLPALQLERPRARAARLHQQSLPACSTCFTTRPSSSTTATSFPSGRARPEYFSGEGEFIPVRPGRNMWETNFIPDLAALRAQGLGPSAAPAAPT